MNTFTSTKQENFEIVTTQNLSISRFFKNIQVLGFLSKYLPSHLHMICLFSTNLSHQSLRKLATRGVFYC